MDGQQIFALILAASFFGCIMAIALTAIGFYTLRFSSDKDVPWAAWTAMFFIVLIVLAALIASAEIILPQSA